jgi:hypothetical protein
MPPGFFQEAVDDPAALQTALEAFGLSPEFKLNSFENWLPSHPRCNRRKREHIFRPTPIIQMWLDRAQDKADAARRARDKSVGEKNIERAIGALCSGDTAVPEDLLEPIIQYYAAANSEPVVVVTGAGDGSKLEWTQATTAYVPPKEVQLGPGITIIFDDVVTESPTGPFTYKVASSAKVDKTAQDQ